MIPLELFKFWAKKPKDSPNQPETARTFPLLQDRMYQRLDATLSHHGFFAQVSARIGEEEPVDYETAIRGRIVSSEDGLSISHHIAFTVSRDDAFPTIHYVQEVRDANHPFLEGASYKITAGDRKLLRAERTFCNFDGNHLVVNREGQAAIANLILEMFPEHLQPDLQRDGGYPYLSVALALTPKERLAEIQFFSQQHTEYGSFSIKKALALEKNGSFKIFTDVPGRAIEESNVDIAFSAIGFLRLADFLTQPLRR